MAQAPKPTTEASIPDFPNDRRSSIGITAEIYVDSHVRTTSGLGYLLADSHADNVLPIRDEARSAAAGGLP